MVMSAGRLGFHKSISAGTYNVYECPAGSYANVVINVIAEVTGSVAIKLFSSPTNTPINTHTIQVESVNSIKNGFTRANIILSAGEWVSYETTGGGVTVTVTGIEYTSNSKEIVDVQLLTTNTEVVLYECLTDNVATINATVTGTGEAITSSSTNKLYLSTTNASGGSLLMASNINSSKTGFEYTGIILSAGQKLILVTSNIVGNIATRVHGCRRDA